jgi:hypothetical protein
MSRAQRANVLPAAGDPASASKRSDEAMAMSDAERKAKERQKKLDLGFALEQVWVEVSERDRMRKAGCYKLQAVWVHQDGRQRMAKHIEPGSARRKGQ